MKSLPDSKLVVVLVLALGAALMSLSCNSSSTGNTGGASYTASASVIADANRDSTKVVVDLKKQGQKYGDAVLRFSADTLLFRRPGFPVDSVYSLAKLNDL